MPTSPTEFRLAIRQVPPCSSRTVVTPAHLVELAGQVEGEHHLLAGAVRMVVDDAHHGADALVEGAVGAVRLQLVVLDEVDPGFAERAWPWPRSSSGAETDARLDDGADQRAGRRTPASRRVPSMPKLRAGIGCPRRRRAGACRAGAGRRLASARTGCRPPWR